jgi:hypothetical protein
MEESEWVSKSEDTTEVIYIWVRYFLVEEGYAVGTAKIRRENQATTLGEG